MKVEAIARIAHEVNRAYCASQGDMSHQAWSKTSKAQKASMVAGVEFHLANASSTPMAQHEAWMVAKTAEGWKHGETKDEAAKTHPAMVPYDQLPPEQRAKDFLFKTVVSLMKDLPDEAAVAAVPASVPAVPAIVPGDRISVKYVGHRGNRATHKDTIYGTELVWRYQQSILVPAAVARVMLARHPEVYGPGDAEATAPPVADKKAAEAAEQQKVQDVRDLINTMDAQAVSDYVKLHYNQQIAEGDLVAMRAAAIQLVEQYGVE